MIYGVYGMRDKYTGFLQPTFDVNDQSAIRNFSMAMSSSGGLMAFAPGDFDLYALGFFDTESGTFDCSAYPVPKLLISGVAAVPPKGDAVIV